jgi:hypothetical protein
MSIPRFIHRDTLPSARCAHSIARFAGLSREAGEGRGGGADIRVFIDAAD